MVRSKLQHHLRWNGSEEAVGAGYLRRMRATTMLIEDPGLLVCVPARICGPHLPDAVRRARTWGGLVPKLGEMGHLSTQLLKGQTCGLRPSTFPIPLEPMSSVHQYIDGEPVELSHEREGSVSPTNLP